MRRSQLSRPVRLALRHEVIKGGRSVFDYGCGRGDDIAALVEAGFAASGWDPAHLPDAPRQVADVVNLGYVVNVIEDPLERQRALRDAWDLAKRVLVVSARLEDERDEAHVAAMRDGWVTRRGTFQKFFSHDELGRWIEETLSQQPVAAALGMYYVFRDAADRELYLSSRFRRPTSLPQRRISDDRFEANREVLQPLIEFVAQRGRLPAPTELPNAEGLAVTFGSLRRAFRVILVVTDASLWDRVRHERAVDLLVHLALARFHGRPRWTDLPTPLQLDVRAFYSSYRAACEKADRLLFAVGNPDALTLGFRASAVGKTTGNGLYVHTSALSDLPAVLRVYEGCARALVGSVDEATVVKLHRGQPKISYLTYPTFDTDAHPALHRSVICDLREQRVVVINYADRANRPILHRKELFVSAEHPKRGVFERLTSREERLGLLTETERIGTEVGWLEVCAESGVRFRGHSILRSS
jgi:DNA phosphorothioation-associated putative methyltransferase